MSTSPKEKSLAVQMGARISGWVSKLFAHTYMQVGVIVFCLLWFTLGLRTDLLTAALSILAITLTQMVLNSQYDREAEAHRRDVAMHAKLDELLIASGRARNEMAGIEELDEEDIEQLKEEVKAAIDKAGPGVGNEQERTIAKHAAQTAVETELAARKTKPRNGKRTVAKSR